MDTATLVDSDIQIGNQVIGILAASGIELEDALWLYSPQVEEWRLFLSTPLVDQSGPRNAYLRIVNTLKRANVLPEVPIRRISVVGPGDRFLRDLRTAFRLPGPTGFRPGATIGTYVFDEAYVYGGSIHIVRLDDHAAYHIIFTPYKGPGGAVPAVVLNGEDRVVDFLRTNLRLNEYALQKAVSQLKAQRSTTVPDLHLETKDLRRLRLLPVATRRS